MRLRPGEGRLLLVLHFVEQHRREKVIAHGLGLPIRRRSHQTRIHRGHFLRDQLPKSERPRVVERGDTPRSQHARREGRLVLVSAIDERFVERACFDGHDRPSDSIGDLSVW